MAQKQLHRWIGGYARHLAKRAVQRRSESSNGTRHLLFAFCDHYEPLWGDASKALGSSRVHAWLEHYPKLAEQFRDADGCYPKHSFFFPGEQYEPEFFELLSRLVQRRLGEVELHLHHDGDTAGALKARIGEFLSAYAAHGHLSREKNGCPRYGFIHGNWCLANARNDGRWCGVNEEIPLLFDTGCYADFTFPSAPDECQPNIVNQIYWPTGDLMRTRAYEQGKPARVGEVQRDRILMIEGPLAFSRRPGTLRPRIEAAAVTARDPATPARIASWVAQNIHVEGRPEWVFVKIHTHGAPEAQAESLLGAPGRAMHRELGDRYNDGWRWKLHYVTAREMFNIAIAAMEGHRGNPNDYRDYVLNPPPLLS